MSISPATSCKYCLFLGSFLSSKPALKCGVETLLFAKPRGRKRIFLDWVVGFFCRIPQLGLSVITGSADIAKQISTAVVWLVAVVAAVCKSWSSLWSGIIPNRKTTLRCFPQAAMFVSGASHARERTRICFSFNGYNQIIQYC